VAGAAGAIGGAVALGPVGVIGALTGAQTTSSSGPTCHQVLAQLGIRPSVTVGSPAQPGAQPAAQPQQPATQPRQPQPPQQQPRQQQQQQPQPTNPLEGIGRGLRGLFGN
jgi:hypothetical protein